MPNRTIAHRNRLTNRLESIAQLDLELTDAGFKFHVLGELSAYKAAYEYRTQNVTVEFDESVRRWLVTVDNTGESLTSDRSPSLVATLANDELLSWEQLDWGQASFVPDELTAYQVAYRCRYNPQGVEVAYAAGAGRWRVTVFAGDVAEGIANVARADA